MTRHPLMPHVMMRRPMMLAVGVLLLLGACGADPELAEEMIPIDSTEERQDEPAEPLMAAAQLQFDQGDATGAVVFVQEDNGVRIVVDVVGAPPGLHGLHLHEGTDCADPGEHFNPSGMPHGSPSVPDQRHAGDFGNLEVDTTGAGRLELLTDALSVRTGPLSVVGHVVVLHRDMDDLSTPPDGNSGPPIACGVVELDQAREGEDVETPLGEPPATD